MSITYLNEQKMFNLPTKGTSYIFSLYEEKTNYKDSTDAIVLLNSRHCRE